MIRKLKTFDEYRVWAVCEECGCTEHVSFDTYKRLRRADEAHNAWHESATPAELDRHEAEERFWIVVEDSLLSELRPRNVIHAFTERSDDV